MSNSNQSGAGIKDALSGRALAFCGMYHPNKTTERVFDGPCVIELYKHGISMQESARIAGIAFTAARAKIIAAREAGTIPNERHSKNQAIPDHIKKMALLELELGLPVPEVAASMQAAIGYAVSRSTLYKWRKAIGKGVRNAK